jgi:hypothetical protein
VTTLYLKDVSDSKQSGMKFKFLYFQEVSGVLTFPVSFTPEKVKVVAQSRGKHSSKVEQIFNWNVEGEPENVGQSQD